MRAGLPGATGHARLPLCRRAIRRPPRRPPRPGPAGTLPRRRVPRARRAADGRRRGRSRRRHDQARGDVVSPGDPLDPSVCRSRPPRRAELPRPPPRRLRARRLPRLPLVAGVAREAAWDPGGLLLPAADLGVGELAEGEDAPARRSCPGAAAIRTRLVHRRGDRLDARRPSLLRRGGARPPPGHRTPRALRPRALGAPPAGITRPRDQRQSALAAAGRRNSCPPGAGRPVRRGRPP